MAARSTSAASPTLTRNRLAAGSTPRTLARPPSAARSAAASTGCTASVSGAGVASAGAATPGAAAELAARVEETRETLASQLSAAADARFDRVEQLFRRRGRANLHALDQS